MFHLEDMNIQVFGQRVFQALIWVLNKPPSKCFQVKTACRRKVKCQPGTISTQVESNVAGGCCQTQCVRPGWWLGADVSVRSVSPVQSVPARHHVHISAGVPGLLSLSPLSPPRPWCSPVRQLPGALRSAGLPSRLLLRQVLQVCQW